jgi:hypothetical protein
MYLHSVREHAHSRVGVSGQEVEVYRLPGARVQDVVALLARGAVHLWSNQKITLLTMMIRSRLHLTVSEPTRSCCSAVT